MEDIENMFETLRPNLNESNIIKIEDDSLSQLLKYYLFLQQYAEEIIAHFPFTYEEILYSQYYWFVYFKNQYLALVGYDGGMDQQAFLLLENLFNELNGEVDWEVIEAIGK